MPNGQVEALHTHLLQAGVVLQHRVGAQGLGCGHGKRLDTTAFDLTRGVGGLVTHHINLAANQGGHGGSGATERNGGHGIFGLQIRLPEQATNVRGRTQTSVRNVQLAGVGTDVVFEIAVGVGGQLRLADQGHGHVVDHAQILKVFQRFVRKLAVQSRRCGHADVKQQECVAIGCRFGHFVGSDGAASAGCVLNDKVAAGNMLAHDFGQITGHAVRRSTCCKRHHDGDRLGARESLGLGTH